VETSTLDTNVVLAETIHVNPNNQETNLRAGANAATDVAESATARTAVLKNFILAFT